MAPRIDVSLDFVCPICGANPQERCEMLSGTPRFESHVERWNIAKDHLNQENRDPGEGLVERSQEMGQRARQKRADATRGADLTGD
jgi:hypothetical protein